MEGSVMMRAYNTKRSYLPDQFSVTHLFLAIQIVIFLLMTLNGGSTNVLTLILFGAKFNPAIAQGEWWRLIAPMFIHIGFTHHSGEQHHPVLFGHADGNSLWLFAFCADLSPERLDGELDEFRLQ